MRSGNTACGGSFAVIGREGNLNDLEIVGYDKKEGYMGGEIVLTKLTSNGDIQDGLMWTWYDGVDEDSGDRLYGWYDDDLNPGTEEPLALGEGVWLQAPDETFKIQSAGEVYKQEIPIQLRSGNTLVSNPCPVDTLNLNDAKITGYDPKEGYMGGEIVLTKLTSNGDIQDGLMWTWYDGVDEDSGDTLFGWYDDDLNPGTEESMGFGEGLWVQAPDETFYIQFPTVIK